MFEPKIVTRQIVIDLLANLLTNETIPEQNRLFPDWCCRLTHKSSRLQVPGQFTEAEGQIFQAIAKNWDFTIDKNHQILCVASRPPLLEHICTSISSNWEVAA
jgi:hypothetical protein